MHVICLPRILITTCLFILKNSSITYYYAMFSLWIVKTDNNDIECEMAIDDKTREHPSVIICEVI